LRITKSNTFPVKLLPAANQPDAYTKQEQKLTSTNLPLSVIALLTKTDYNYKKSYKFYVDENCNMKETISYRKVLIIMAAIPSMDSRLYYAIRDSLGRWPVNLYDLKKVKTLEDFSCPVHLSMERSCKDETPGDFSAIGEMANLHTLIFDNPHSRSFPPVTVHDFSFLCQCKKLKKLDMRQTNFTDCSLLLQLPSLKQVFLPLKNQLINTEQLDELASRSVKIEFLSPNVALMARMRVQGHDVLKSVVEEIKRLSAADCYILKIRQDLKPGLFDSKFGGLPYWDLSMSYPTDQTGNKLILLAQINFDQYPVEEPLPQGGMLQFFAGQDYFPVFQSVAVTLEKGISYIGPEHCLFDDIFTQAWKNVTGEALKRGEDFRDILEEEAQSNLYEQLSPVGHHLLGWPYFTQYDPRPQNNFYDTLLFQMDSDSTEDQEYVMWGDNGVGNFFINGEDLKKRDFSNVFYTWDCF
jgi:uncharacterized protein YwqG